MKSKETIKLADFEIEEMIERELEEGNLNSDGEVWFTAEDVNVF